MSLDTDYINMILEQRLVVLEKMLPIARRIAYENPFPDLKLGREAEELYWIIRSETHELRTKLGKK